RLDLSASVEETGHLRHPDVFAAELRKAGLLLAINFEGFSAMVPGKLYEYWAIGGAPILVLGYSRAAQKLVEQHQLGKLLALDDVQGIANALMYYCREFAANKPVRISRAGVQSYDRAVLTAALVQELESVASVHSKRGAV
ncbi:MAG TPA: hypothetical protein VHD90_17360, partial [Phototrophicaceae bacterium]|nr:hypothetical protein [Phototrophicaceae bacterium]